MYLVFPALLALPFGLLIVLVTRKKAPRVASATMAVLAICVGVIFTFGAVDLAQKGYHGGSPTSRLLRLPFNRIHNPTFFWFVVCSFGVPGVLLWVGGLAFLLGQPLLRLWRSVRSRSQRLLARWRSTAVRIADADTLTNASAAFDADLETLRFACLRVANALAHDSSPQATDAAADLRAVADALKTTAWEAQSAAAASLRGSFLRWGIAEWPAPSNAPQWADDLRIVLELSTIHVERRYREVAIVRSAS